MCDDFIKSVNSSGVSMFQGDTVTYWVGTTSSGKVKRSATTGDTLVAGVCVYPAAINSPVAIAIKGIYKVKLVYFSTPTAIGGFIRSTSSGGGGCSEMTTAMAAGVFGWTLEIPSAPSSSVPVLVRCLLRGKVEYYF
jgi:hypothetical protein